MRFYKQCIVLMLFVMLLLLKSCESPDPDLHRFIPCKNNSDTDVYVSYYHTNRLDEEYLEKWRFPDNQAFSNLVTWHPLILLRVGDIKDNAIGPPYTEDFGHYSYWEWVFNEEPHVLFVYIINAISKNGDLIDPNDLRSDKILRVYELYLSDLQEMGWFISYDNTP